MIVSSIIYLLGYLLTALTNVLPTTGNLPIQIDSALNFFIPKFSSWNVYIPLSDFLIIFSLVLTIEFAIFTFHSADWIYKKLRG